MKRKLFFGALNAIALLSASALMAQNFQAIPVQSGFTADVIANGVGSSSVSTNNDVDGVSYAFVAKDFQLTSASTPLTYGLPSDGIINSAVAATPGLSYQLGNLSANNSLRLAAVNDTGTLIFTTPKAAFKVYMLSTSGSGTSVVSAVVNFTDGTSQTFSTINLSDWYGGTNFAIQGIGRINRTTDALESGGGTNPRLYQIEMAIDPANQSKLIQSVTVTKISGGGLPNIFAFSADVYSDCVPPTLQAVSAITANSALVSWTAPSNAVSYDVYHSTSNTMPTNTTTPTYPGVTGTSTTIGSLNSNTTYYYWVRTNCSSATSQSAWSFAGTFKTACSTFTAPYTENFDTTTTGSSTNNNAPSCWAYLESASFTGYGYVAASNNYSAPNSYYLYNSSATTGSQMLVSPPTVNLSDGTKRVRFYAKAGGAGYSLQVGTLSNPTDPSTFTQIGSDIALTTTHTLYTVNIPAGSDLQLAFKHGLGGTYRSVYIDDITVQAIPSCIEPTAVTPSNIAPYSATIDWTAPATVPAMGYEVYYSTSNTAPTSTTVLDATNSVTSSTTSAPLSGLSAATTYYIWVRSKCSASDISEWSVGSIFTTACVTFTVPYTENFDTTTTGSSTNNNAPSCWAYLESASFTGYGYVAASNNYSAPNSYYLYNSSATTGSQMLVSPPTVNLSDGTKRVRFYAKAGGAGYSLQVGTLSNPTDPSTFTQIGSDIALTTTHTLYTVNIPAGSDLQLAFKHGLGGTYRSVYIDDITVQAIPSCIEPTVVTPSNIAAYSATIDWTAPATVPAMGYEVYYSTSNTAPTSTTVLDATNSVTSSTTSAPLSGLSAATTYYIWVRSKCSASDVSEWSIGSTFTTACATVNAPFVQTFDNAAIPNCWTNTNPAATAPISANLLWKFSGSGDYGTNTANNGKPAGTYAWVDASSPYSGAGVNTVQLVSPSINLTGLTAPYISFEWYKNHSTTTSTTVSPSTYDNNKLTVEVNDGNGWVSVFSDTTNSNQWRTVEIPLAASYVGATIQVRFTVDKNVNGNGYFYDDVLLDNINVKQNPNLATSEVSAAQNKVKVYPNPFKDVLNIADMKDVKSVTVMDLTGRVVKTIDNPTKQLYLGELSAGLYLVTVNFKDGSKSTVKAIKQ
ncbi:fibronectin type III domain-containing protein [Chryseobacterium daecheongense]|uniref:fibronectin type III domain-containing protein n=1 Tax=Chryseobacterium daecheongense TaxID=192389 RepID=UPI001FD6ACDC|nr:fibronectin type III domain-containing protein [Chryseobacterium daecheongense]UOV00025.1 fibronectin type III domain-containing protein [Chryseobacterium daecheongense]